MLHHVSFSVRNPHEASTVLSELVGGVALKAPAPPFPRGSWFVTLADEVGSMIELLPWGAVQTRAGISQDPEMRPHTASHVLIGSPLNEEEVLAIAERQNLVAQPLDTGLFRIVKVWIEDSLLIELLTREHRLRYVDAFASRGMQKLDGQLRRLEQELSTVHP